MNPLASRWASFASRERLLAVCAAVLIIAGLVWSVAVSPALKRIRAAHAATATLDAQLESMRQIARDASSLQASRKLSYDETLRALEQSIKTLGGGATLSVNQTQATVSLRLVKGESLAAWLGQLRANARLMPVELKLSRSQSSGAGADWDGSVSLRLEGAR